MSPGPCRFVLDADARRSDDGLILAGGSPGRLVRLTAEGSAVVDAALAGGAPAGDAGRLLLERLAAAGLLHPEYPAAGGQPLTFVVPVRDGGQWLGELVGALAADGEVIVVDDRSQDGSAAAARTAGAAVIASAGAPGPAGARNTGLAAATSELVAFVDADCVVAPGWAAALAGYFEDPSVALVAPRVRAHAGARLMERYEALCSPLDLGAAAGLVGRGRRTGYVPAAACLVRREALLGAGGFDEQLRWGEDVDLVHRLAGAGWTVRYAPHVVVEHRARTSLRGFARQRYEYGRSAAALEVRHPGAAAPLHVRPSSAGVWASAGLLGPAAGVVAATRLQRSGRRLDDDGRGALLGDLAAAGHRGATRHLARALTREWAPLTAVAALASRRARRLALAAVAVDVAAVRPWRAGPAGTASVLLYRPVDHLSYAAGLWSGAVQARSAAVLVPRTMVSPASGLSSQSRAGGRDGATRE